MSDLPASNLNIRNRNMPLNGLTDFEIKHEEHDWLEVRNPFRIADGRINCEVNHPVYGWSPFTASPTDVEQFGREIFAQYDKENLQTLIILPQRSDVRIEAERRIAEGIIHNGEPFRTDAETMQRLAAIKNAMTQGNALPIQFETRVGQTIILESAEELDELIALASQHIANILMHSSRLQNLDLIPLDFAEGRHWTVTNGNV